MYQRYVPFEKKIVNLIPARRKYKDMMNGILFNVMVSIEGDPTLSLTKHKTILIDYFD